MTQSHRGTGGHTQVDFCLRITAFCILAGACHGDRRIPILVVEVRASTAGPAIAAVRAESAPEIIVKKIS